MQNKIIAKQKLLNSAGHLANPGYALQPFFEYSRKDIKASIWRIKEWDYYAILNPEYGCSFTIADLGYSALLSAVFFDFKQKRCVKKTKILWFTFGKMGLPCNSLTGNVSYQDQEWSLSFERFPTHRIIKASVLYFDKELPFEAEFHVQDLQDDSMVIATPWFKKPKAFYYNQKVNCMPTKGFVSIGNQVHTFSETNTFAVLDWGRGVWTYKNTWFWSSASGLVQGKRFGFNFGYGFGDTSKATENMLFYEGVAHKLNQVSFEMDPNDVMKPWVFTSPDHRVHLTLTPLLDRKDDTNFIIIKNLGDQVFGHFNGTVVLDDSTTLQVENLLGFAERITNHY
ncbi:MAG: DUF2804 domain-containing protein [bacterium]|nr:DUF2804 domain-containing protein [bacterium]